MKKHTLALTALTLAATLLAGCSNTPNTPNPAQGGDSTTTQSASTTTESTESTESTTGESTPEIIERERFTYGEKEIPDIIYSQYQQDDGRAVLHSGGLNPDSLDSMVFETHEFGDYTIRMVGYDVRTDKEHFPGIIYAGDLRFEVEKNGVTLYEVDKNGERISPSREYYTIVDEYGERSYKYPEGTGFYGPYGEQFSPELLIFEDQIGNYIDVYDMKHPVIAIRYFNADNFDEPIRKLVHFAWIEDDMVVARFFGDFAENTGVVAGASEFPSFTKSGQFAVFAADEFKIENENTLVDEEAGIRYIFDFDKTNTDGHFFSTERIQ